MKIFLSSLLSFCLLTTLLFGQSTDRTEGIVLPVATLGDVTETRRQILQNTLIESLSSYYRLVPQDKLEEVQEKIFQEMDYDECTEDQCIVMIQEALQVENLFVLQVIGEGDNTQLGLMWVGLDDKNLKTDVCKGCDTFELNERVTGLVRNLESVIPRGGNFVAETVDEEKLKREREEKLKKQREEEQRKKREEELRKQRERELIKQTEEERESIVTDTYRVSTDYQLRGIIGTGSSENSNFNNLSLHFLMGSWGIGFSNFYLENKSTANVKYELDYQSLDVSYSFKDNFSFTIGTGLIITGKAISSTMNLKSSEVSGLKALGLIGANIGDWEALGGYQYSIFEYKNFTSSKNLSLSGGQVVFGIGKGF